LTNHPGFPEQIPIKGRTVGDEAVHVVGDHSQAEGSVSGDVLAARNARRKGVTVTFFEKVEVEPRRAGGRPLPKEVTSQDGPERLDLVRIASECVEAGR